MYKMDLSLNNLQWLICHKTKPNLFLLTSLTCCLLCLWKAARELKKEGKKKQKTNIPLNSKLYIGVHDYSVGSNVFPNQQKQLRLPDKVLEYINHFRWWKFEVRRLSSGCFQWGIFSRGSCWQDTQPLLKFVNSAVNVSSNLIGCFEVVPLAPAFTVIWVKPTSVCSLFCFFQHEQKALLDFLFLLREVLLVRLRLKAVFS